MIQYSTDPLVCAQNTYERIFFAFKIQHFKKPNNTMKKRNILFLLAVFTIFTAISPTAAFAAHSVKGNSASLIQPLPYEPNYGAKENRVVVLKAYLEQYDSPLANHAQTFIDEADKNNLDWKLVAAIAGVESYFGQMIPPYSNNGWGYGVYGNNVRTFSSWDDGISTVSQALRSDYLGKNPETNVYQIGSKYAADPHWAVKVTNFMNSIDAFSEKVGKPSLPISL